MAGVSEAMGAQSPPSSTPNWLERLFLCLEVVLGEPSWTQSLPRGQGGGGLCQAGLEVLLTRNRQPHCYDSTCGLSQMGVLSENNPWLNSRHLVHLDRVLWIMGIHAQIHLWKIHPGPSREIAENRGEPPANLSHGPVLDCRAKAAWPRGWILLQNLCQGHGQPGVTITIPMCCHGPSVFACPQASLAHVEMLQFVP